MKLLNSYRYWALVLTIGMGVVSSLGWADEGGGTHGSSNREGSSERLDEMQADALKDLGRENVDRATSQLEDLLAIKRLEGTIAELMKDAKNYPDLKDSTPEELAQKIFDERIVRAQEVQDLTQENVKDFLKELNQEPLIKKFPKKAEPSKAEIQK